MSQLIQGVEPASLYEYHGSELTAFTVFFIPFQIAFVAARFYSRHLVKANYAADSVLCAISLASQMVMAGLAIGSVFQGGVGHHVEVLSPDTVETFSKYLVAISTLYFAMTNIPKFAILCLYRRVFPQKPVRISIYVIGFVLLGQSVGSTIAALAACHPFAANWDPTLLGPPTNGFCVNKEALFIWSSFPGILTDVALLVLPIPVVLRLNMNKKTKAAVSATFLVGSFGLVTSCLRFWQFYRQNSFIDPTWAAVDLIIWTQVEAGVYLISACLMTFKPLLELFSKSIVVRKTLHATGLGGSSSHGKGYMKGKPINYGDGGHGDSYPLRGGPSPGPGFTKLDDDTAFDGTSGKFSNGNMRGVTTEISASPAETRRGPSP